ncbi:MAG: hypothetical protein JSV23_05630 [Promethearchaeota archaeon]|nr:MAG: hypothetical protein JSV23_05630 [Candidatus Lokiarchaeota archaeon]
MPGPYDELEKKAEELEKNSKEEFNNKNFIIAINLLEEAKQIYSQLRFQGKVGMINQRIARLKNLVRFEKQDTNVQIKSEQDFQKRVQKAISEKKEYEDKKVAIQKAPSPQIKRTIEKINMLKEKAEKEEKLKKYSRVIGRYEYILELYKSIPTDIMDLSKEILEIESKLSIAKTKK